MMFAPFNEGLVGHEVLLKEAGLDTRRNEWFKVYDFTTSELEVKQCHCSKITS